MNTKSLLLEIGLEDLPARMISDAQNQLAEKVSSFLTEQRISFSSVEKFSTPRRLAVLVHDVASSQESLEEEAKGPAKKIAQDENGEWTKAALGFARGQGIAPEDLYIKELKGVEYVFGLKKEEGKPSAEVLTKLSDVITSLQFPKTMRWATGEFRYVRPIKWLIAMLGEDVIPFEVAGVATGKMTGGHRFLGQNVELQTANDYEAALEGQMVVPSYEKRQAEIVKQIHELEAEKGWVIPMDEDLLEEVTNLVEYPSVLFGGFQESFLRVPQEVLITSMKEHQRYFPVMDKNHKLLPFFVTVRNGNKEHLEQVRKGNEKVLTARLADAAFFYDEDQKKTIEDCTAKLTNIVFHEDLGTLAEKMKRVGETAKNVKSLVGASAEDTQIDRVAEICKFDLVTNMVYEFPELQGKMGEYYAILKGESEEVAHAINEHYMPRNAEDSVPPSELGALLSLSDKLDTIVGFFGIGNIPSGSADPYALRRQAAGVLQIVNEKGWNASIEGVLSYVFKQYDEKGVMKRSYEEVLADLDTFFKVRLKTILQDMGIRFDVIEAVLSGDVWNVHQVIEKAKVLNTVVASDSSKVLFEALNRIINISKHGAPGVVNEELLTEHEQPLYNLYQKVEENYVNALQLNKMNDAFELLSQLEPKIVEYFEHVMVMSDDEAVKVNRLTMLANIKESIVRFADTTKLVTK